jgi:antitoxin (DNA-binding transcriptional repressor) of toxin-antitoxin stability system
MQILAFVRTFVYTISMPTTRTISIREFRKNMTQCLREAQELNTHFIVMRHTVPVAHVSPINEDEASIEALAAKVAQARKDAKEGRVYTPEEVLAMIDDHANDHHRNGSERSPKSSSSRRARNREKNAVVRSAARASGIRKKTH